MVKKIGSHNISMLYPNPCYNKVFYKGTALYKISQAAFFKLFHEMDYFEFFDIGQIPSDNLKLTRRAVLHPSIHIPEFVKLGMGGSRGGTKI